MRIVTAGQSTLPPPDKPMVKDPVRVYMDIPLYYATERGPAPWDHPIFCAEAFAKTVLEVINTVFFDYGVGFVHIGFYNPRKARRRNGAPIEPARWSNHAYGEAVDWKGVVTQAGDFVGVDLLEDAPHIESPFFRKIWTDCAEVIRGIGRDPEIVNEGSWVHIGIWPERR